MVDHRPPDGAEADHDGVIWRIGGSVGLRIAAVASAIALCAAGAALGPYGLLAALLCAVVPVLVFLQASRRSTIRVSLRCVIVETRGLLGRTTRRRIPLDEIRQVRVAASDNGDHALVVGTGDARITLAPRERREHLEWLCDRIEQARASFAEQERRHGREWGFLRKAPGALDELIQHADEAPSTRR